LSDPYEKPKTRIGSGTETWHKIEPVAAPAPSPAPEPGLDPEFAAPPAGPAPVARAWSGLVEAVDKAATWVGGHRRGVIVGAVVFQLAVLLWMVVWHSRPLVASGSQTVLLHVVPVDPRDLFRGDYVTLSYDVSRMSPLGLSRDDLSGRPVYVTLAPDRDGRHYHGAGASLDPPPPGSGPFLRGTATQRGLAFGIESYFVQEGKGKAYEDAVRRGKLWAEVAVAPDGRAALRGLVIE
jgi:uncharacterized membrane-anchored protein